MKKFVTIYFYIRPQKINKSGQVPIYCRLSVSGEIKEFSINKRINEPDWDWNKQRVKGTREWVRTINHHIDTIEIQMSQSFSELHAKGGAVTVQRVFAHFSNHETTETVIFIIDKFISDRGGVFGVSKGRINRYKTTKKKLIDFFQRTYKKNDMLIADLSLETIQKFRIYLGTTGIEESTGNTHLKIFKMVGKYSRQEGLTNIDPFEGFKCKVITAKPRFLTEVELKTIMEAQLPGANERLERVRDAFIFSCFTGLAHADLIALTQKNIIKGVDGKQWIELHRKKTGNRSCFPLLPIPLKIIQKYKNDPVCKNSGKLLDILSNQKMNDYLKLIGTAAGIEQELTTHMGRHTFATLSLTNGVSIESVSKALGHRNIRTTSIYGQVVDLKIKKEMEKMADNLNEEFN